MMKQNKHIEIVCSTQPGLSSMGVESRNAIKKLLQKHYQHVSIAIVNDVTALDELALRKPDLAVLGMKFIPSDYALGQEDPQKIWVSDYLSERGIRSTGSPSSAHNLELNKPAAKRQVHKHGLATARSFIVTRDSLPEAANVTLPYPMFVKPANRGGGQGIDELSVVNDRSELNHKISKLQFEYDTDALIEEYLPGREFSVAVLRLPNSGRYRIMPVELITEQDGRGHSVLGEAVKESNVEQAVAVEPGKLRTNVCQLALDAFYALGARDYGRIDIRLNAKGVPHFLEANLIPSLIAGYGSFPKACLMNEDVGYDQMVLTIVEHALGRDSIIIKRIFETPAKTSTPIISFDGLVTA